MYRNARSHVTVSGTFSGSVLSPLLFIVVLEALSSGIKLGCPEELFCADALALINETREGLKGTLEAWKGALESNVLRVNFKKAKMIISSENPGKITIEATFPCAVCRKGVGSNSIICQFCRC